MPMAPSQSARSKNLLPQLVTIAIRTVQMMARITMSMMTIPLTQAIALMMAQTMIATTIMVGTVARVAVRTDQIGTRPRQTSDPVCLGDILFMIGFQPKILKHGAGPMMSVFDERHALDGLQRLDSQAISAIYDQYFSEVYRYVRYRIDDDRTAEDIAS